MTAISHPTKPPNRQVVVLQGHGLPLDYYCLGCAGLRYVRDGVQVITGFSTNFITCRWGSYF